ncbi:efflux RND transporter permease subunit [Thalassomonas viridans]|uniref:Efflux RND transporter permease subunit n=1 Tax=Thalassomonas viridans TaxID=137584 RepID=A0AAE9Z5S1_9GAMM|nr:efflux RND transporter permease subunit [Thalassomonas viridans]WDE06545.1 efflux RND transporter permease subunit [Thalassomonas viridans]
MIRYFTAHPTAANLLMLLLIFLGISVLPDIKRETFPEVKAYSLQVNVPYPGATPADVEQGICLPLEDALDGISFIEEKVCEARQNLGLMTIKMLEQGDFVKFTDDVKTAIDGINEFPDNAEEPVVTEKGRTQHVISIALTADLPRSELKTLAENLKQRILQHPQIPLVKIAGFSERQLRVQVSQENLRRYGLDLQQLVNLINKQDLDLPLGSIETGNSETQLRFSDERRSALELAELVILTGEHGNEIRLGEIATIIDTFEQVEDKVEFNGRPAALLKIEKNTIDDSLDVLAAVEKIITAESARLPAGVSLDITQDATSIVKDRINMLLTNAWQGLLLVFATMWLFFTVRYAFWVVMGLPVSFLASAFVLGHMGITINMISMVALLLALGILMDDAIVIAESIGSQLKKGLRPMQAAVEGTKTVARGVASSYATTLCIFIGLVFIQGDLGQILKVIPIVLISVISVSLIEAFFILPNHLHHSLAHGEKKQPSGFRVKFEKKFEHLRTRTYVLVEKIIHYRYAFIGAVIALFFLSVSMLASGILQFSAFPNVEGDRVQAQILMPAGTPLKQTEQIVSKLLDSLEQTSNTLQQDEDLILVKSYAVSFNQNPDAFESGPHLAIIDVDLLSAEIRNTKMQNFINLWRDNTGTVPDALTLSFKEPSIGPSGRAIQIRLTGNDLDQLAQASYELQTWLSGYPGVNNLLDDLRPGKPEFTLKLKEGAYNLGIDAQTIATQVRSAFQGNKVLETNVELETFEITVMLTPDSRDEFADFDNFPIVHPTSGAIIPLSTVAEITATRGYSRIGRYNNQRAVTVYGDIDATINNTNKVMKDLTKRWLPDFQQRYPDIKLSQEGETKNSAITQQSMMRAFVFGLLGVFLLLSFQFRSYVEPVIVLVAIPLALIGTIWGHLLMGLSFTMPSMLGFVSLAGIVVNDSILLVEFVKKRILEGHSVHQAAAKASYDRFRAVFLTSVTTIAGMTPLLFESSLQAQVLIPLATSIVFGIATSTLLVLFVLPCLYTILEDFGLAKSRKETHPETEIEATPAAGH